MAWTPRQIGNVATLTGCEIDGHDLGPFVMLWNDMKSWLSGPQLHEKPWRSRLQSSLSTLIPLPKPAVPERGKDDPKGTLQGAGFRLEPGSSKKEPGPSEVHLAHALMAAFTVMTLVLGCPPVEFPKSRSFSVLSQTDLLAASCTNIIKLSAMLVAATCIVHLFLRALFAP